MSGADDLFTQETAAPTPDRLGRATALLAVATPLVFLGPLCFTGVPGALLALIGWQTADEELARTETGALPADRATRARRTKNAGFGLLVASMLSFVFQIGLFAVGFYDTLLRTIVGLVTGAE